MELLEPTTTNHSMIKLKRDREFIEDRLPAKFYGVGRESYEYRLLKFVFESGELPSNQNFWNPNFGKKGSQVWSQSRDNLLKESNQKCAYCDRPMDGLTFNVEHFRPKSVYWWMGYSYMNYLSSCQDCNFAKGPKFPIEGPRVQGPEIHKGTTLKEINTIAGTLSADPLFADSNRWRSTQKIQRAIDKEKALVIDPYLDDPQKLLMYHSSDINKEVNLIPRYRRGKKHEKARITIEEIFELNRPELKKDRYNALVGLSSELLKAKEIRKWKLRKQRLREIKEKYSSPELKYTGMFRYFLRNKRALPRVLNK